MSVTSSEYLAEKTGSLIKSLPGATWRSPGQPATITVATLKDLLQNQFSSELLIILETSREAVLDHIDTLRTVTGAQCAIFLPADQPNIDRWFEVFGAQIAARAPIDLALGDANKEVERFGFFLASTQTFMIQSNRTFFPPAIRRAERNEGRDNSPTLSSAAVPKPVRRRSQPLPNLEIEGVRMEAPPPAIRVMQAQIEHGGQPVTSFPSEGVVEIQLSIQPISPLKRGIAAFPDQNLDWNEYSGPRI